MKKREKWVGLEKPNFGYSDMVHRYSGISDLRTSSFPGSFNPNLMYFQRAVDTYGTFKLFFPIDTLRACLCINGTTIFRSSRFFYILFWPDKLPPDR